MAGFIDSLVAQSKAPDWFFLDRKQGVSEEEMMKKLRAAISNDVDARGYSRELWTEQFIDDVSVIYFKFYDKLYKAN